MRVQQIASVVIVIALSWTTTAWAQGKCRERAFAGIGLVAHVSGLSINRLPDVAADFEPPETAQSPTVLFEGAVRVACRVGIAVETLSLGTVSDASATEVFSQTTTESERLWFVTGRFRLLASRFVAPDGLGGVGALNETFDTTNVSNSLTGAQASTTQEVKASTVALAYGGELVFTAVRHVEVVGGLRGLRLKRDLPTAVSRLRGTLSVQCHASDDFGRYARGLVTVVVARPSQTRGSYNREDVTR